MISLLFFNKFWFPELFSSYAWHVTLSTCKLFELSKDIDLDYNPEFTKHQLQ